MNCYIVKDTAGYFVAIFDELHKSDAIACANSYLNRSVHFAQIEPIITTNEQEIYRNPSRNQTLIKCLKLK